MLPRPTAEPIAERMNTFREPKASRCGVWVGAGMPARIPEPGHPSDSPGRAHSIAVSTPPSARSAAPFVADARTLER